jgi:type I restriction enzyme S subunit
MSDWKTYRLEDIVSISSGGTPPKAEQEYWGGDIPWISASSMNGYYYSTSELKVTEQGLKNGTRLAPKNSILLLVRGSILHQKIQVGLTTRDVSFNQDVKCLQVKEDIIEPLYLLFWFKSIEYELLAKVESTGIGAGKIDTSILKDLEVTIPPLDERIWLLNKFKSITDKIELNRQMNQTLEAMAQALFKSWFVDFDPVIDNALASGTEIPEALKAKAEKRQLVPDSKKLRQTNPELAKLFPSAFVFNETLGKWIPEMWEVKTVNDVATVVGGGTPSTKIEEYFCEEGIPWLSPKDLSGYEWKYISKGATDITNLGLEKSSAKLMPAGTVLFSSRAPIGYIAIAENEICTNQGFKSLVPNKGVPTEYLFQFLKASTEKIDSVASGSTFKEVSGTAIKGIEILVPSENLLKLFVQRLEANGRKSLTNQKENDTLTRLRDTLLPQLISGKVRVPERILSNNK